MEGSSQTITDFLLLPNLTYPFHLMSESLQKSKTLPNEGLFADWYKACWPVMNANC